MTEEDKEQLRVVAHELQAAADLLEMALRENRAAAERVSRLLESDKPPQPPKDIVAEFIDNNTIAYRLVPNLPSKESRLL